MAAIGDTSYPGGSVAVDVKRTSKLLSLVLRHRPQAIGLTLDAEGWADVDALIALVRARGHELDRPWLERVVAENDKRRFAFSADGLRIRASQGHSLPVDLGLAPMAPPEVLYHGTVARALPSIRAEGLLPGRRQHVHLSADVETARRVGGRRGEPVVLVVEAGRMAAGGGVFHRSDNGVWLTAAVPPEHIVFPEAPAKERPRGRARSGSPYEARYGFSRAIRVGRVVHVAGTAPIWPDGSCDPSPAAQARRAFTIALEALAELGGAAADVVRTRMYITRAEDADAVGAVHGELFADARPAATMVVVAALLDPRWKVEVEVEAIV